MIVTNLLQSLFHFIFIGLPACSVTRGAGYPEKISLCHPCVSVSPSEDAPHIHRLSVRLLSQTHYTTTLSNAVHAKITNQFLSIYGVE